MPVYGGTKLRKFLRNTQRRQLSGVRKVECGFYEDARYPNGIPVTNVAAWLHFGTKGGKSGGGWGGPIPPRPFIEEAMDDMKDDVHKILMREVEADLVVTKQTGQRIGNALKNRIQSSIKNGGWKGNADATLALKYPKDRPAYLDWLFGQERDV